MECVIWDTCVANVVQHPTVKEAVDAAELSLRKRLQKRHIAAAAATK